MIMKAFKTVNQENPKPLTIRRNKSSQNLIQQRMMIVIAGSKKIQEKYDLL